MRFTAPVLTTMSLIRGSIPTTVLMLYAARYA